MNSKENWIAGVDLGGTKVEVAKIFKDGRIGRRLRRRTHASRGAAKIEEDIVGVLKELQDNVGLAPRAVGVGVAGQVEGRTGKVRFAPNLDWHDVPLQADLEKSVGLPVTVANDVYAVTRGEWLHGAGKDCADMVCLFIGTGIGGGVVSGGRQLEGASHTAGELGHIIIDYRSEIVCPCGNHGCLEVLAGGTAIGRRARERIGAEHALEAARISFQTRPAKLGDDAGVIGAAMLALEHSETK